MNSKHRLLIAGLFIAHGLVRVALGCLVLVDSMEFIFSGAMISLGLAVPSLFGGYNLLIRHPRAHQTLAVASIVNLLDFPLGVFLSVYYYWYWKYKCGSPKLINLPVRIVTRGDAADTMMKPMQNDNPSIRDELIARVTALDGKQSVIDENRKTLGATIEALTECTSVDPTTIATIANQLSVKQEYTGNTPELTDADLCLEKNTKIAKNIAIVVFILFAYTMFKWLHVNSNLKSVMHDVSPVQSRTSDYYMRSGHYPFSFKNIGLEKAPGATETIEKIEMGPQGQLLISTNGWFGGQVLLTPSPDINGLSKWHCATNSSWLFKISYWLCSYQSSLHFRHS